jgi:hypothetical protein
MGLGWLAQYEWILIEVLVLGILVWQLVSVRRLIRADRERAKAVPPAERGGTVNPEDAP